MVGPVADRRGGEGTEKPGEVTVAERTQQPGGVATHPAVMAHGTPVRADGRLAAMTGSPPSSGPAVLALVARVGDALGASVRPTTRTQELADATRRTRQAFEAAACSVALVEPEGGTPWSSGSTRICSSPEPSAGEPGREPHHRAQLGGDQAEHGQVRAGAGAPVGRVEHLDHPGGLAVPFTGQDHPAGDAAVERQGDPEDRLGPRAVGGHEPQGAFDEALGSLGPLDAEEDTTPLQEVAEAFRSLAGRGPAATRLATRLRFEAFTGTGPDPPARCRCRDRRGSGPGAPRPAPGSRSR